MNKKNMKRKGFKVNSILCSGDWSKRDELPTLEPIGDIEPRSLEDIRRNLIDNVFSDSDFSRAALKYPLKFIREQEAYHKSLRERGRDIDSKFFGTQKDCCDNPKKYKNIISNSLKFYSCSSCGADLGDINE